MSEKRDSSNRQKNEWLLLSVTFAAKVGFCLNIRKRFFFEFSF